MGCTNYVSPLTVVKKKDGSVRVCVDARFLNSLMEMDHVQAPNVSELLYNFSSGQMLSTLDLTSSYWQVPILEKHQKYTGFMYDGRTYVFTVLLISWEFFMRAFDKILGSEVDGFVISFVVDLSVFSPSPEMHLQHLRIIFEKFRMAGITVKLHVVQSS